MAQVFTVEPFVTHLVKCAAVESLIESGRGLDLGPLTAGFRMNGVAPSASTGRGVFACSVVCAFLRAFPFFSSSELVGPDALIQPTVTKRESFVHLFVKNR